MLEAGLYADNSFLTLTYADDPYTLEPHHHRQFMDALRKRIAPLRVRFYMVGEYGEKHGRPHFHYALFGYPSCRRSTHRKKIVAVALPVIFSRKFGAKASSTIRLWKLAPLATSLAT